MRKNVILLFILFVVLTAESCATGTSYVYYVLDPQHNVLLAHDPKNDLELDKTCNPDEHDKAKCIAMLTAEYAKMKQELLELRESLKNCQKGKPPIEP